MTFSVSECWGPNRRQFREGLAAVTTAVFQAGGNGGLEVVDHSGERD